VVSSSQSVCGPPSKSGTRTPWRDYLSSNFWNVLSGVFLIHLPFPLMDVCWPVPTSSEGTYLVDLLHVLTHLCIQIRMGSEPQCDDYLGHADRCCYGRYSSPRTQQHCVRWGSKSLSWETSSAHMMDPRGQTSSTPCGYCIGSRSEWVEDSGGSKFLWLPPNWGTEHGSDARWNGNFLALVGGNNSMPITIGFQA